MYSACKLNKQGNIIQPWCIPFPIWNQYTWCPVLTIASWPAYRFLRRQIRWSSIPKFKNFPVFFVIHTVRGFSTVSEAEIDVFLEFPYFFYDPADVGNSISGSSVFFKFSLYIWKFTVHILFEASLEGFWALPSYYVKWIQFCGSFFALPCPSLRSEQKLTFSFMSNLKWHPSSSYNNNT